MTRDEVLRVLSENREVLERRFAVRALRLFGSVARGEASESSDLDLLVDFTEKPSLVGLMRLRFFLESLLGAKVDLTTESGLRDRVRPCLERDAIRVP
jgi:uncharacterized protein